MIMKSNIINITVFFIFGNFAKMMVLGQNKLKYGPDLYTARSNVWLCKTRLRSSWFGLVNEQQTSFHVPKIHFDCLKLE